MRIGHCEYCGNEFEDRSPSQSKRFCRRRCQQRAHEQRHRAPCPECGGPMGAGSGCEAKRPKRCDACDRGAKERGSRMAEAAPLWYVGLTIREIAEEVATTPGTIAMALQRARRRGWDVPYRRPRQAVAA